MQAGNKIRKAPLYKGAGYDDLSVFQESSRIAG